MRTFKEIVAQAKLEFDEHREASYGALERSCARKLARIGGVIPVDISRVRDALVRFCEGGRFERSCVEAGVSIDDVLFAGSMDAEVKLVMEYGRELRERRWAARMGDRLDGVREMAFRMAEDEGGEIKVNAKHLDFMLERMDRENFGDSRDRKEGGRGKVQVTYNIPGMTVNMITAPSGGVGGVGGMSSVSSMSSMSSAPSAGAVGMEGSIPAEFVEIAGVAGAVGAEADGVEADGADGAGAGGAE